MNDRLAAQYWLHEKELTAYSSESVRDRRRAAMERFEVQGFPTVRDEDWKYSSLKPVLAHHYGLRPPCAPLDEEHLEFKDIKRFLVNELDSYRVVFLNGRYSSWLSDTTHRGFDVCTLSSAWKKYPETIDRYFAQLTEELGPLAQLNTALVWDGLYVVVPDNVVVDRPIQVLSFTTGTEPRATQIRSLVVLGMNAQAEIIERHQSLTDQPTWTNSVDEAYLAAGAQLRWVKLQHDGPEAALTQHTRIQQARDSRAQVHTISTSGRFIRNNLDFLLNEPGADARMLGLTLAKGKQLVDHHTLVDHRARQGRVQRPDLRAPGRPKDRRLPAKRQPGAARARRGQYQAAARDFCRRRQVLPRLYGGPARRRRAVLPARPRNQRARSPGAADAGLCRRRPVGHRPSFAQRQAAQAHCGQIGGGFDP